MTNEEKRQRAAARAANADARAEMRARRRAEALRCGIGTLRWADVAALFGVNESTVWRWVQAGTFAHPVRYSAAVVGWSAATVRAELERRERGEAA